MCADVEAAEATEKRDRVVARATGIRVCGGAGLGPGRGGGGGDCRGGCLIARWFAGARVVGRWHCMAMFEGGERLL